MENTLGKRIAAQRKHLGLTQEQLAEKLGITAQAVSKWENDLSCPDISVLPLLADIFGISTDELLGRNLTPVPVESAAENCDHDDYDDNLDDEFDDDDEEAHTSFRKEFNVNIDGGGKGKLALFGMATWFLTVGTLFLLSKVFDWECSFWDVLWPSFLLVFGIFGMIGNVGLFNLSCAAVGAFFLVSNLMPLPLELDKGILWAVIIIVCGIMLLLDALRKRQRKVRYSNTTPSHEYRVADGFLQCSNSFGEEKQVVVTDRLTGGKISNSFGEYIVDFSEVEEVSEGCAIEASCSFGELELRVPKRYAVTHKSSTSFAGFDVDGRPDDVPEGVIHLKASVSFGEITIKYI